MEKMRLQTFIARSGVTSRRKAEQLILQGRIQVNEIFITRLGTQVNDSDTVKLDGKIIKLQQKNVYIMLNKPEGYITSVKDQFSRKTVLDLVAGVKVRVFPVGRLDYDTSGLLILTNDGEFTHKLTHPSHEIKKVYIAKVKGFPGDDKLQLLRDGISIDGQMTSPAAVRLLQHKNNHSILEIIIHEGRNRQVRKMCEAINHPVVNLKRVAMGTLNLGNLKEGEWRYLEPDEIAGLI